MPDLPNEKSKRSRSVRDILERIPSWPIMWGNTLLLLLICLVMAISWFVKYPDLLEAEATITTTIPPHKAYSHTSGKLKKVLVQNGQNVHEDQPLVILENSADDQDVYWLKAITDTITYSREFFKFPLDMVPVLFLGEIEPAFAAFEDAYLAYSLNNSLNPYRNDASEKATSLGELNRRLELQLRQQELIQQELALKKKDFERQQLLHEQGAIAELQMEQSRVAYLRIKSGVESSDVSISQLKEQINRTRNASKRLGIDRIRTEINLLKNVVQTFSQLKNSILEWELKYVLKSKIDGRVLFYNTWQREQSITAGELLFTIIPTDHQEFMAILELPALNSGKVAVGQKVLIELVSYPKTEYGVIIGQIQEIPIIPNEEGFYYIKVSLNQGLQTSYGEVIEFRHEIQASAEVITEDLRLIDRFFSQLKRFDSS